MRRERNKHSNENKPKENTENEAGTETISVPKPQNGFNRQELQSSNRELDMLVSEYNSILRRADEAANLQKKYSEESNTDSEYANKHLQSGHPEWVDDSLNASKTALDTSIRYGGEFVSLTDQALQMRSQVIGYSGFSMRYREGSRLSFQSLDLGNRRGVDILRYIEPL